jgi:hypothetical protein
VLGIKPIGIVCVYVDVVGRMGSLGGMVGGCGAHTLPTYCCVPHCLTYSFLCALPLLTVRSNDSTQAKDRCTHFLMVFLTPPPPGGGGGPRPPSGAYSCGSLSLSFSSPSPSSGNRSPILSCLIRFSFARFFLRWRLCRSSRTATARASCSSSSRVNAAKCSPAPAMHRRKVRGVVTSGDRLLLAVTMSSCKVCVMCTTTAAR